MIVPVLESEEGGYGHVTAIITDIPSSRIVDTNHKIRTALWTKL